jgi:hypothetical protein
LKYLAALVPVDAEMLPVKAVEFHKLAWQDQAALDAKIVSIREDINRRHAELVTLLENSRVLTAEEAGAAPQPEVDVVVYHRRRLAL